MIIAMEGNVRIEGKAMDVLAETACILHSVYGTMKEKMGEEQANENLALIGRLAVCSEQELDAMFDELIKSIVEKE